MTAVAVQFAAELLRWGEQTHSPPFHSFVPPVLFVNLIVAIVYLVRSPRDGDGVAAGGISSGHCGDVENTLAGGMKRGEIKRAVKVRRPDYFRV